MKKRRLWLLLLLWLIMAVTISTASVSSSSTVSFEFTRSEVIQEAFDLSGQTLLTTVSGNLHVVVPAQILAKASRATFSSGSNTAVTVGVQPDVGQLDLTLTVDAKLQGVSRSASVTLSRPLRTPIGTSSVVFDTVSIPALDALLGKVTIDATPTLFFAGEMVAKVRATGPATVEPFELRWIGSGERVVTITFTGQGSDVKLWMTSPQLLLSGLNLKLDIAGSIRTILGTKSYQLGMIDFPFLTNQLVAAQPTEVLLAEFEPEKPILEDSSLQSASEQREQRSIAESLLVPPQALVGVGIAIAGVAVALGIKSRGKQRDI